MAATAIPPSPTASPSKRVYTEDTHIALYASRTWNSYSNGLVSEDLAARLQNVGSRVRKCVTEGYKTQASNLPCTLPNAPFNTPAKSRTMTSNTYACISPEPELPLRGMQASRTFKTSNEAIIEALNTPSRTSDASHRDLPRKRGRDEYDEDQPHENSIRRQLFVNQEPSLDADGDIGMEEEEEDVEFYLGHNSGIPRREARLIKPLRKGSPEAYNYPSQRTPVPSSHTRSTGELHFVSPIMSSAVSDITTHMNLFVTASDAEVSSDVPHLTPDMFNQLF